MKVKARISKTNRFREVTLRREPDCNENNSLYSAPAYLHQNGKTISGIARETDFDRWVFVAKGSNASELYS